MSKRFRNTSEGFSLVDLGDRIRRRRLRLDMTQLDLAKTTGVSTAMISSIERGTQSASISTLDSIANGLQTSVSQLLFHVRSRSLGKFAGPDAEAEQQPTGIEPPSADGQTPPNP